MGEDWAARFPELFRPRFEEYANADLELCLGEPDDEQVTRLHAVPVDPEGRVVVCRSIEEWRFLPGGRREPGETLAELCRRELREEAGCTVLGDPGPVFVYQHATSRNAAPYRAHFSHPVSAWAYVVARVEVTDPPTNPPDGESVVEVCALPAPEAAAWVRVHDREHADVILLAEAMGLLRG
ncbi:NUDIX hydrolase [Nocardioides sp.]|jgi:8-oxo-dGTP diphosphatase|uniref:NUDIX hydrolase n=1 Tax=Nocardioides sp. TaxID=35761 RepID=UPI002F40E156